MELRGSKPAFDVLTFIYNAVSFDLKDLKNYKEPKVWKSFICLIIVSVIFLS